MRRRKKDKKAERDRAGRLLEFRDYADHPRFGRYPQFTDLKLPADAYLGVGKEDHAIPNTVIAANRDRLKLGFAMPTHYLDQKRVCRDCGVKFIFFAAEQQFWYEELGLHYDVYPERCCMCRSARRATAKQHERFVELATRPELSPAESLEAVRLIADLVAAGEFLHSPRRTRMWLNRAATDPTLATEAEELRTRLAEIDRFF